MKNMIHNLIRSEVYDCITMKNTHNANNASLQPVRHRLKLLLGWPLDRRCNFRLTNDSCGCT